MTTRAHQPAFPFPPAVVANGDVVWGDNGMSIREHFAGLAMQGIVANPYFFGSTFQQHPRAAAEFAAEAADALIAELAKEQK